MLEVVIDTNVLVSGIGWSGSPQMIIDAWKSDKIIVKATESIIEEYQIIASLFSKKYKNTEFESTLNDLLLKIYLCKPAKLTKSISRDPDDDKFIACALNTKSKIIISGDADLLDIPANNNFFVMKPRDFCDTYLSK